MIGIDRSVLDSLLYSSVVIPQPFAPSCDFFALSVLSPLKVLCVEVAVYCCSIYSCYSWNCNVTSLIVFVEVFVSVIVFVCGGVVYVL